jgi:hypothetical protein
MTSRLLAIGAKRNWETSHFWNWFVVKIIIRQFVTLHIFLHVASSYINISHVICRGVHWPPHWSITGWNCREKRANEKKKIEQTIKTESPWKCFHDTTKIRNLSRFCLCASPPPPTIAHLYLYTNTHPRTSCWLSSSAAENHAGFSSSQRSPNAIFIYKYTARDPNIMQERRVGKNVVQIFSPVCADLFDSEQK